MSLTPEQKFRITRDELLGDDHVIHSLEEGRALHSRLIELRVALIEREVTMMMPHYRGEHVHGWDIQPGIFRPPISAPDAKTGNALELQAINEFEKAVDQAYGKGKLRELFHKEKFGREWDLRFQAQHAGIKTTLIDWTPEITSALYFATEESVNPKKEAADGQVWVLVIPEDYILGHNTWPERDTYYDIDPSTLTQNCIINSPSYLDQIENRLFEFRMYRQKGRFMMPARERIHIPINNQPEMDTFLLRYRVPAANKTSIRAELAAVGLDRQAMYIDESALAGDLVTQVNHSVFGI